MSVVPVSVPLFGFAPYSFYSMIMEKFLRVIPPSKLSSDIRNDIVYSAILQDIEELEMSLGRMRVSSVYESEWYRTVTLLDSLYLIRDWYYNR